MEDCKDSSKNIRQNPMNFNPLPYPSQNSRSKKFMPLIVYTELYIEDLNSFKPVTMDFRLDFFLKHRWSV
ncbi:unnamed protein product, partial [Larinioides sclopetarius]